MARKRSVMLRLWDSFCEGRVRECQLRLTPYIQDRSDLHIYLKQRGWGGL